MYDPLQCVCLLLIILILIFKRKKVYRGQFQRLSENFSIKSVQWLQSQRQKKIKQLKAGDIHEHHRNSQLGKPKGNFYMQSDPAVLVIVVMNNITEKGRYICHFVSSFLISRQCYLEEYRNMILFCFQMLEHLLSLLD